jgi:methylmalonyl-CoA mutase N-terminal domain/subunit
MWLERIEAAAAAFGGTLHTPTATPLPTDFSARIARKHNLIYKKKLKLQKTV